MASSNTNNPNQPKKLARLLLHTWYHLRRRRRTSKAEGTWAREMNENADEVVEINRAEVAEVKLEVNSVDGDAAFLVAELDGNVRTLDNVAVAKDSNKKYVVTQQGLSTFRMVSNRVIHGRFDLKLTTAHGLP